MRKNILKTFFAVALISALFMVKSGEVKAYPKVQVSNQYHGSNTAIATREAYGYIPADAFDYDWYLQRHPEVAAAYGTDRNAIYKFYRTTGLQKGWQGRIAPDKLITAADFDYMRYAADYPDLAAAFGQDGAALYNHYVNIGINEGRNGYTTDTMANAYLKIYSLSAQLMPEGMSDMEKVQAVHDWLCLNVAYDYDNYLKGTVPSDSRLLAGPMNYGTAVCQGYVSTFQEFMNMAGIECTEIVGSTHGGDGDHAWNRVKVDGVYYYVDVTWDDPVPDRAGYVGRQYFMTQDITFGGTHVPQYEYFH